MLQKVAWTVAVLVMVINGYLLLDFIISEVRGVLFALVVCSGTAAYITFIVYLVSRSGALPSTFFSSLFKRFADSGN